MMNFKLIVKIMCCLLIMVAIVMTTVNGHGMLMDPIGRASRWRIDSRAPADYDDNGVNCGGYGTQMGSDENCGICGDAVSMPQPRPHELGGRYGAGDIVATFIKNDIMWIGAKLTANHLGYYYCDICNLDKYQSESAECFAEYEPLMFVHGLQQYEVGSQNGWVNTTAILPTNLECKHCVLRWSYVAGNNWGACGDGSGRIGCGPQETFRSCADISIL